MGVLYVCTYPCFELYTYAGCAKKSHSFCKGKVEKYY